ncbi:MAG: ribonuclease III [Alphaproteobacteria bacterium]|nr:ribonuclease III [Alphaproteobacteria bacterium]
METLQQTIGYTFQERETLETALTHRSWTEERGPGEHNERLEFLGDAVVQLLVTELLFEHFGDQPEGALSRIRSAFVKTPSLAEVGRRLGLGALIRMGKGEENTGGRKRAKLLANAFEALLGAIYIDGDLEACRSVVRHAFGDRLEAIDDPEAHGRDPKSELQEWSMAHHMGNPTYTTVSVTGPAHQRVFRFSVSIGDDVLGEGEGGSKRNAQRAAAKAALDRIHAQESE